MIQSITQVLQWSDIQACYARTRLPRPPLREKYMTGHAHSRSLLQLHCILHSSRAHRIPSVRPVETLPPLRKPRRSAAYSMRTPRSVHVYATQARQARTQVRKGGGLSSRSNAGDRISLYFQTGLTIVRLSHRSLCLVRVVATTSTSTGRSPKVFTPGTPTACCTQLSMHDT